VLNVVACCLNLNTYTFWLLVSGMLFSVAVGCWSSLSSLYTSSCDQGCCVESVSNLPRQLQPTNGSTPHHKTDTYFSWQQSTTDLPVDHRLTSNQQRRKHADEYVCKMVLSISATTSASKQPDTRPFSLSVFFFCRISPTSSHQPVLPVARTLHDRRIGTVKSRVLLSHQQMKESTRRIKGQTKPRRNNTNKNKNK
jgi:hypothetical protein